MKFTAIFLLIASLAVSAAGHAQSISLSRTNAELQTVLKDIERQSGYQVFFNERLLQDTKKVNVELKSVSLTDALNACFKDQPVTYTIVNKTIVIKKRENFVDPNNPVLPPPIDVRGRVVNENGEPVNATVTEKGTTNAVGTDAEGYFIIKDVAENAILVITSVGIEKYELKVNNRSDLATISVKTKIIEGSSVTVFSNGYQNIPKERATGAFDQINNQLINRSVSRNVIDRLKNVTSGMSFNKRDAYGTDEISIRGRSTIFSNTEPLVVVDNFPYEGEIGNINPNDVLNISILKDAAAASIWGARAANGVIVITTKRGINNESPRIELNSNFTIVSKPDPFYLPKMSSSDIIGVEQMLFDRGFYNDEINNTIGPAALSPVVLTLLAGRNNQLTPAEVTARLNDFKNIDNRYDLLDYSYHRSSQQQYALNVRGGGPKSTYYLSIGYDKGNSYLRDINDRITINTQHVVSPLKKLDLAIGVNYIADKGSASKFPSNVSIYPYERLLNDQGGGIVNTGLYRKDYMAGLLSYGYLDWTFNPVEDAKLNDRSSRASEFRLNASAKYQVLQELQFEVSFQFQKQSNSTQANHNAQSYYTRDLINRFSQVNIAGQVIDRPVPQGNILETGSSQRTANNGRLQLNYNKSWNENALYVVAGFEAREVVSASDQYTIYGYNDNFLTGTPVNYDSSFAIFPYFLTSQIDGVPMVNSFLTDRFASYFANGSYTFKRKYVVSGSARVDQSNYFGVRANQRAIPLWSTGIKWNISKEKFYGLSWLPSLSFRATYGYNGNINKSVTALTTVRYLLTNAFNQPYASILNPANPDLRWEKTGVLNLAMDFVSANNIISGSIDFYTKKGTDLFGDAPIDGTTGVLNASGQSRYRGNVANMKGRGLDIQLTTRNINGSFEWYTDWLFNYNTEKVANYKFTPTVAQIIAASGISPIEGKPLYGIYSYTYNGLNHNGDPAGFINGQVVTDYAKLINPAVTDLVYHGRARPAFWGSVRNTFNWKGFSMSALIAFKYSYYFRRTSINYANLFTGMISHKDFEQRWQHPGDELTTTVPAMVYPAVQARETFYSGSSALIERGDHVRLQDIQLSYSIGKESMKKLPFSQARVYAYINNIGILWRANDKGIDPDYQQIAPQPLGMSMGINLSF